MISEAASAIDRARARSAPPRPSEDACRRYYAAHESELLHGRASRRAAYPVRGDAGIDVLALRKRAEACLLDVRCHDGSSSDAFGKSAGELSNCPSAQQGGELGWLLAADCAPEFARELFGRAEVGVLPRLVHSRFGLHVVEVLERDPGVQQPFEAVKSPVRLALRQQAYVTALRQCLKVLAGNAVVQGVDLDAAESPLVQ